MFSDTDQIVSDDKMLGLYKYRGSINNNGHKNNIERQNTRRVLTICSYIKLLDGRLILINQIMSFSAVCRVGNVYIILIMYYVICDNWSCVRR